MNGGDDTIITGSGNDVIIAGNGADQINVGDGGNVVLGDRGVVELVNGIPTTATSEISVNAGDDSIIAGTGFDGIIGGGGNDNASQIDGLITIEGIDAGDGDNYVLGDDGVIGFASGLPASALLTPSPQDGNDIITTGAGRDFVYTGNGDNNRVASGDGHDDVIGGSGSDDIDGQGGNDWIVGLLGDDIIDGGAGHDVAFGGVALGTRADYYLSDLSDLDPTKFEQPAEVLAVQDAYSCLLYTSPSPRDLSTSRMPSSA